MAYGLRRQAAGLRRIVWVPILAVCWGAACSDGSEDSSTFTSGSATETTPGSTGSESEPTTASSETSGESASTEDATEGSQTETSSTTAEPLDCGDEDQCGVLCVNLASDPENCGVCGVSCIVPHAIPACAAGVCSLGDCLPGYSDCDDDINNGCEAELPQGEECPLVCDPQTPEVCNLFDDNCNESCDENVADCRHGVHRAASPTLGHFYTTDLSEAMSGDYSLEFENFFYMYSQMQDGLVALHRCLLGNGKRFYTTSASCEGAGSSEGVLGHLGGEQTCGSVPLFRLHHGTKGHFYTTSAPERDNAVDNLGYKFEATVGYVWQAP